MRSMTGFGAGEAESSRVHYGVTLRAVNHRFLDLAFRLPAVLRPYEPRLRKQLEQELSRGRVEVTVEVSPRSDAGREVSLDLELLGALENALEPLRERGTKWEAPSWAELVRVPGLIDLGTSHVAEILPDDEAALDEAVEHALSALVTMRREEGGSIREALLRIVGSLRDTLGDIEARREEVIAETRSKLEQRLATALQDTQIEEARLAQEVAVLVEKSDVTEEVDRWAGHLDAMEAALAQEGPVGKRLDFLAQELLREVNTVGSKARDLSIASCVVESKLACEALREQVLNVE